MRNGLGGLDSIAGGVFLACVVSGVACGESDDGNGENQKAEIASWKLACGCGPVGEEPPMSEPASFLFKSGLESLAADWKNFIF
jgi:hypothetical protein